MAESASSLEEQLHPLLLGYNALELFDSLNLVMISYALLVFAPRWKHTLTLTLVVPCLHSILYVASLVSAIRHDPDGGAQVDFTSFSGIVQMFDNPNVVFVGWVHYIVFDHLVARMILMDSIQRRASLLVHFVVVVPCMFLTLMAGPTGFLTYMMARQIVLPISKEEASAEKDTAMKVKVF